MSKAYGWAVCTHGKPWLYAVSFLRKQAIVLAEQCRAAGCEVLDLRKGHHG